MKAFHGQSCNIGMEKKDGPFQQQSVHAWRQKRLMFVIHSTFFVNGIVVCVENHKKTSRP
jgi:hypothetical protein